MTKTETGGAARKMVQHKDRQYKNRFGGMTYTTLCGRMNAACNDGMNVANTDDEVTCKFCLRRMELISRRARGGSDAE